MDVEQVDRAALGPERLEGRPAEQAESPGVVGVAVDPVAIEGRREIDQAEAIAVGHDGADDDRRGALGWAGVGGPYGPGTVTRSSSTGMPAGRATER